LELPEKARADALDSTALPSFPAEKIGACQNGTGSKRRGGFLFFGCAAFSFRFFAGKKDGGRA